MKLTKGDGVYIGALDNPKVTGIFLGECRFINGDFYRGIEFKSPSLCGAIRDSRGTIWITYICNIKINRRSI